MTPRSGRVLLFSVALSAYAADRFAKLFALKTLSAGQSIKILPDIFHFTLVFNNGAAFGLFRSQGTFFVLVSAAAVAFIISFAWRHKGMPVALAVSLGLVLGGALGNLVDRVSFGYVIDFFDFRIWPVFNVADSAITVGVVILVFNFLCTRSSSN